MHLTNYSVNKKNENFVQNETSEHDDFGFKWSLSAFCKHLETVGINMSLLWSRIYDVIIKTMACGESYVLQAQKKNQMDYRHINNQTCVNFVNHYHQHYHYINKQCMKASPNSNTMKIV